MKKIKIITSLGLVLGMVGLVVGIVIDEVRATPALEGVAATVTVENIALTVADGVIAYGIIPIGTTTDTTALTLGVEDSQTVTNTGNVTQDFNIRGYNSANWALGATPGTDIYRHDFCIEGTGTAPDLCDVAPVWVALDLLVQPIVTSTATGTTQLFDLRIHTPTATIHFGEQHVNVTVQAIRTP